MNKKFLSAILFGALMVSSTGTFVSCKDYDDDIDNINKELSTLKGDLSALQAKVNEGKWITSLAPTTGGFTVTFSDNTSYTITNGKDGAAGADAVKWEIGTDGFWYKNDVKTEYQAVGQAGEAGVAGVSPYIGENGNWFAYNTETKEVEDTGISAAGTSTYVVKNGDNYELHVYNQTTGEYESIVLPATAAAAALNVVFMPTYSDMQTRVVAINIPVGDELNDKNHLWDNNVSLTNDIVFNYRVSPASIDLAKANIGFLVNEVQSRAAGSILDVADKSFADGVLTVKAKAGEAFSLKNKKYAVALQVQNDAQTALSTYHLLTSQTIDRRNLTVFEARKDDNGDESYMNWSTTIPMNLLYTGELNVADTLSVGDYTSYNSYKDLRKYGFAPYYEVAKKAGEDKGNYFTVENGVIKTNGQISSVGHNCTFIVSVYDKKDGYKLAEKELTVSSVEKIATTKTYTKSETHELTLESKDYRFKFDMNDVYNTLGMSSQTFWSAGYTREYYIWDAERSEYVQTSSSNGVISAGTAYENNESFLYVNVKNILTKDQLGKYKVVFKIGNTGAEVGSPDKSGGKFFNSIENLHLCTMNNQGLLALAQLILPSEILSNFEVVRVEEEASLIRIYLDESVKAEYKENPEIESKGFCEAVTIRDFPIRDKGVDLIVRRRKWYDKQNNRYFSDSYDLKAEETRYSKEFAAFLKGVYGDDSYDLPFA